MKNDSELIRKSANEIVNVINKIGLHATSLPKSKEAFAIDVVLIDLLKRIMVNINAFNIILIENTKHNNALNTIPMSLCLRTASIDCLTASYLLCIHTDDLTFINELHVMSLDYARYLKKIHEIKRDYEHSVSSTKEFNDWFEKFRIKHAKYYNFKNNEWILKSADELRSGSNSNFLEWLTKRKYKGKLTEDLKFEYINESNKDLAVFYIFFRYFSQHQHYGFANRGFIEDNTNEDFIQFELMLSCVPYLLKLIALVIDKKIDVINLFKKLDAYSEQIFQKHNQN